MQQRETGNEERRASGARRAALLAAVGLLALGTPSADAVEQTFDVDEGQSTFTSGSIDVEFTAVVNSNGLFGSQTTTGSATIENVTYAADGTVVLDTETSQVTLQDLSIGGDVNQSGMGELVWADLFTFDILYTIASQMLDLNAPLTMALSGGTFSGTPSFQFSGVSDGAVSGSLINYSIPPQNFSSPGNLPVDGTLATLGGDTLLELTGSQLQVDLGSAPTIVTEVNECALRILVCVFFLTTAEITIDSLVYNDVQMNLVGTAPAVATCGDGVLDPGEGCDDGNTTGGDGCSAVCQPEVCGNGVLDPGETCDDGNTADGDGCPSTCQLDPAGVPALGPWGVVGLASLLAAAGGRVARRRVSAE